MCCEAVCGGGADREQWCLLHSLLSFSHSLHYPQSNWAPLVLVPSRWACACSRPLWVSPMTSLVRLGVSPAAAPTPMGVFTPRFQALFPRAGALGCALCFAPPLFLLVYLCTNVGPWGATHRSACHFLCHSESGPLGLSVRECGATGSASGQTDCPVSLTLRQSLSRHGHASPLCPRCPSPPLLPVWMNVYFLSLVSDFLAV